MAGPSIGTWVKVRNKSGRLTARVIPNKFGGGSYSQGEVITQSEFQKVQEQRAESRSAGRTGITRGFHIRDTLVAPSTFNALPRETQQKILEIKKEFDGLGYVDMRIGVGPARAPSDRQKKQMQKTASRVFELESQVRQLLKTKKQVKDEQAAQAQKKRQEKLTQLNSYIQLLEGTSKVKSPRMNATKRSYLDAIAERDALLSESP